MRSFIIAVILAHFLLFVSFLWQPFSFWLLLPLSLLVLISFTFFTSKPYFFPFSTPHIGMGIATGFILYVSMVIGKGIIVSIYPPLMSQLTALYELVQPKEVWQYLLLFLLVIPGEEIFWRGFVLERLLQSLPSKTSVVLAALLYTTAHLFSGSILLVLAALLGGLVWGYVYIKTKNITICILSHTVFNLFLLILFPIL
ncbi:CPBP family intramembrane glutamic endopeptidase [Bacillus alkalicellulosilyticus]|uniref:CPBP family intramembrane glutamic endopeptidase n=1 Tax=Alkalihalobacterium alkalicellulosilyticum TaxID=1912214 RepID=UPI000998C6DD|nr:type II CAAX endopeptidase family protein [Bacillus alkalicellulosilyticus]